MKVIFIVFIDFDPKPSVKIVWVYFFFLFFKSAKRFIYEAYCIV